jgi:ribosome-associated protein
VIVTARNDRHAQAIARELLRAGKAAGQRRWHAAGLEGESGWVLLDFDEVVVHVFVAERRDFYALEALWSDVPRVPFEAKERPAGRTLDTFGDTGWSGAVRGL